MENLNIHEQYGYFTNAINSIGTFLLTKKSEDIEYYVFEEFDGDCTSFFDYGVLLALLSEKLISKEVFRMSSELAKKFRNLEQTALWNSSSVKTEPQWMEILTIADKIRSSLE